MKVRGAAQKANASVGREEGQRRQMLLGRGDGEAGWRYEMLSFFFCGGVLGEVRGDDARDARRERRHPSAGQRE